MSDLGFAPEMVPSCLILINFTVTHLRVIYFVTETEDEDSESAGEAEPEEEKYVSDGILLFI